MPRRIGDIPSRPLTRGSPTPRGRADRLALTGRVVVGGTATLTGLAWRVNVSQTEGALDTLAIDTGAGDTLDTSAFPLETIKLEAG